MKRLVVFTGAGVSAESGINTFRDSNGLWEQYRIEDVATPEAFQRDPSLVLEFYNQRRKQVKDAKPNAAHRALVELEKYFKTQIITQNIDDLHERAGSTNVIHLHGQIMQARSTGDESLIYDLETTELVIGDKCEKGFQLRPHIVWFGEMVPEMERATYYASMADVFIVIGSSLEVYPAAGLLNYAPEQAQKYLIDPNAKELYHMSNLSVIKDTAGKAVPQLVKKLINNTHAS
ncbi:MAG: NAD-dependent deacylase [Bacteroidetes bacterium]|nr:NAD-dependent deacylase [Bacteroidota bacterium]HNR19645.1 NAD-dependent deacylase [Bacteroidia bacterium]HNU33077.1 NAD-dependent deacylase [Bacteroidia bacterium]